MYKIRRNVVIIKKNTKNLLGFKRGSCRLVKVTNMVKVVIVFLFGGGGKKEMLV